MRSRIGAACAVLGVALAPRLSAACGLTPPIGPNGLPTVCHGEANSLRMRVGLAAGGTDTTIRFGTIKAKLLQAAVTGTFDLYPTDALGLSVALGSALVGHIDYLGARYDLLPGILGGVGVSYRFLGGKLPFIHSSLTLSLAKAAARAPDGSETTFTSRDWRVGVAVGKAIGSVAAPFAVFRYFGAGTHWSVAGGKGADDFRYHVGVGSAFGLSEHWDALTEIAFLGERRATVGMGYTF